MSTYVYGGLEVLMTGRKAKKKRKRGRRTASDDDIVLYEIKSVDPKVEFVEWVSKDELFEVED